MGNTKDAVRSEPVLATSARVCTNTATDVGGMNIAEYRVDVPTNLLTKRSELSPLNLAISDRTLPVYVIEKPGQND